MTTEIFDQEIKKLNQRQKEAVETIDGPVMVVAGPGTGQLTIQGDRLAGHRFVKVAAERDDTVDSALAAGGQGLDLVARTDGPGRDEP